MRMKKQGMCLMCPSLRTCLILAGLSFGLAREDNRPGKMRILAFAMSSAEITSSISHPTCQTGRETSERRRIQISKMRCSNIAAMGFAAYRDTLHISMVDIMCLGPPNRFNVQQW